VYKQETDAVLYDGMGLTGCLSYDGDLVMRMKHEAQGEGIGDETTNVRK
jgi:hypothetical protein